MRRIHKEKLKSYILVFLIITSFIQVGILWDYQNHGLPINFFMVFSKGYESGISDACKAARENFFVPYRIIASDGNMSHWIIGRNDEPHSMLWGEAKSYLGDILSSKQGQTFPGTEWGSLVQKKGFVFEFKSEISLNLLKWFLELSSVASDTPGGVHKFMIQTEYGREVFLYILYNNVVYKYPVTARINKEQADMHDKVIEKLKNDRYSSTRVYNVFGEMFQHQSVLSFINPDILGISSSSRYRDFKSINYYIPDKIGDKEAMADAIFPGNEKDSFDRYIDNSETVIFRNLDSIYRIYNNGLLEYKYLPEYDSQDKGSQGAAFVNATRLVNTVNKNMNSTADMYLSWVREKDGSYEFAFDYIIGDIPVFINVESKGKSKEIIRNAAVIEANSKRMLNCHFVLRIFEQNASTGVYKVDTVSLLDESGLNIRDLSIKDMGAAYLADSAEKRREPPVWYIETTGGENHFVKLPK